MVNKNRNCGVKAREYKKQLIKSKNNLKKKNLKCKYKLFM